MTVLEILDACRIAYRRHGESNKVTEGWVGIAGPCVFCSHGPDYLGVHVRSGAVRCWACGKHRLSEVLVAAGNVAPKAAVELAKGLDRSAPEIKPPGHLVIPPGVGDLLPPHRAYLERRGFDPDELARVWGIRGIGRVAGKLAWRVWIPIPDRAGRVVSWTTRAIGRVPPENRYYAAPHAMAAVPRAELLFGEHLARHAVLVTEGPFGMFALGPGAVCTLGTGFSRVQVCKIARYPVRVTVYDAENAAQRRAAELADELRVFPGETWNVILSSKDPDTAPVSEIRTLRSRFGLEDTPRGTVAPVPVRRQ